MHKIILADDQAIFGAGTAKVLAIEDDLQIIAQCQDCPRLYDALTAFRGAIVIVASSMLADLSQLIAGAQTAANRLILVAEYGEVPPPADLNELYGLVYRSVSITALLETVRKVIRGERSIHSVQVNKDAEPEDLVGARVRDRLTPKEMKIVALIVRGCKNREIGWRLGTTEQVIKNCLLSIYDKIGVSDRVELAQFTINHRTLAVAANESRQPFGIERLTH
jgi:DNA-binding NarL/FixJ family response regulator